jgi:hypothetical protein
MSNQIRSYADLPAFTRDNGSRPRRGSGAVSPWRIEWNRRTLLQRAGAVGVALSVGMLTNLPPARRAWASHTGTPGQGYQILDHCPNNGSNDNDNCLPGCGPSTVYGDACIDVGAHEHWGWHKGSGCCGPMWKLRPDECAVGSTAWDGWIWGYSPPSGNPCGGCANRIVRRCHDGWRCDSAGNNCSRSICRHRLSCS